MRRALLFGPLASTCFRPEGPDALPDAPVRFVREAAAFGAITSDELTERERRYWSLVETAARRRQALVRAGTALLRLTRHLQFAVPML